MDKEYTTVEEQVEYGLDKVPQDRSIEVPLRDLLYMYKTIGEFIAFFHQPMHYTNLEAVQRFMGDRDSGAFHLLGECYYSKFREVWPEDIKEKFDEGSFDNPVSPYYYQPTSE